MPSSFYFVYPVLSGEHRVAEIEGRCNVYAGEELEIELAAITGKRDWVRCDTALLPMIEAHLWRHCYDEIQECAGEEEALLMEETPMRSVTRMILAGRAADPR